MNLQNCNPEPKLPLDLTSLPKPKLPKMTSPRDKWWHDMVRGVPQECEPAQMDAEDALRIAKLKKAAQLSDEEAEVEEEAGKDKDVFVLFLPPGSDIEINALQRGSTIVLQKSLKEGFGLTVSEAMWKGRPVIAGAVGGIPLQIAHRYSGILTHSIQGTAHAIRQLINEPEYAKALGQHAREHVRNNFLITRHLKDYMLLFISVLGKDQDVVNL